MPSYGYPAVRILARLACRGDRRPVFHRRIRQDSRKPSLCQRIRRQSNLHPARIRPLVSPARVDPMSESLNVSDEEPFCRLTWLPSPVAPYHRRLEAENAVRQHRLQRGARVVRTSSSNLDLIMRKPRLLGIFLLAAALMSTGAEFAVARSADEDDVSVPLEWKNQIIADLEHNKRYLPRLEPAAEAALCDSNST